MTLSPIALLYERCACNFLVCLRWCSFRCKTGCRQAHGILVHRCVLATGFEHSVANMTILALHLLIMAGMKQLLSVILV